MSSQPTSGAEPDPDPADVPAGAADEGSAEEQPINEDDGRDQSQADPIEALLADLEATSAEDVVRGLAEDLEKVATERDEYLDDLRRMKAEYENYRKRSAREAQVAVERSVDNFVVSLLNVLDACDQAVAHGDEGAAPIANALESALKSQGLERVDALNQPFDPEKHEAVAHEPGDGEGDVVVEVMRAGYLWKGRALRPAMVKVRG